MTSLPDYQARLDELVTELREKYGVPGAIGGVRRGGEVILSAAGVLNTRTGVEITTDALFLIGSITKVWTATMASMLAERGLLDLDAPIAASLPELRVADPWVPNDVSIRDLLSHRSGIEGDHFVDHGRGDDAVERYVAGCTGLRQLSPNGTLFSYGNSGFIMVGRAIEHVTGRTYREALHELLIEPLGLTTTVTTPEDALLHRTSVGHQYGKDGSVEVWPAWAYPWSMAPAGSTLTCSMTDLLAFGAFHLDRGRTAGGEQLLSPDAVAAMQEHHVALPYPGLGDMCLGWFDYAGFGTPVLNHGGGSPGGLDYLYVLPDHDLAFGFYANIDPAGTAKHFGNALRDIVFAELADVVAPDPQPFDLTAVVDPATVVGQYVHTDATWTVEADDSGTLTLVTEGRGHVTPFAPYRFGPYPLRPLTASMVEIGPDELPVGGGTKIVLLDTDGDGRIDYLHSGYRAFARI